MAPAVDVFVSGHAHEILESPIVLEDTGAIIVQAGSYARWVGRLDLLVDLDTEEVLETQAELVPMDHDTVGVGAEMLAWVRARAGALPRSVRARHRQRNP